LEHVTKKIWSIGSAEQRHESVKHSPNWRERDHCGRTDSLINHEGQKQTHRITRQISTKTGLIQC